MVGFGGRLRAARLELGVTLAEAETATKIRQRYLEALEEEDYGALPPTVHAVGFVRCYASYLGLDVESAVRAFYRQTGLRERPEIHPEAQPLRSGFYLGPQTVTASIVLVFALGFGVYFWNQMQVFMAKQASSANLVAANPAARDPALAAASTAAVAQANAPVNNLGVTLDLKIVDRKTYLRVYEDDQKRVDGWLEPGLTLSFKANEQIYVQSNDGSNVEVTLNGRKLLDRLGPRGANVDRLWSAPGR